MAAGAGTRVSAHPFHAITDKMKFIACFLRACKGIGDRQRFVKHLNTVERSSTFYVLDRLKENYNESVLIDDIAGAETVRSSKKKKRR